MPNMCIAFFALMFVIGLFFFQRHCSHDSPVDVVFSHFPRCSVPLCLPYLFLCVVRHGVCACEYVKWRFPTVDRVRSQYQSVSRKRQADMDDMEMNRGATANVTNVQRGQGSCVLSHADA